MTQNRLIVHISGIRFKRPDENDVDSSEFTRSKRQKLFIHICDHGLTGSEIGFRAVNKIDSC